MQVVFLFDLESLIIVKSSFSFKQLIFHFIK